MNQLAAKQSNRGATTSGELGTHTVGRLRLTANKVTNFSEDSEPLEAMPGPVGRCRLYDCLEPTSQCSWLSTQAARRRRDRRGPFAPSPALPLTMLFEVIQEYC